MAQYKIAQDFVLNTQLRKLTQGRDELNLPELSYRLLVCLIEHAPNVVPHQTLHQQVFLLPKNKPAVVVPAPPGEPPPAVLTSAISLQVDPLYCSVSSL